MRQLGYRGVGRAMAMWWISAVVAGCGDDTIPVCDPSPEVRVASGLDGSVGAGPRDGAPDHGLIGADGGKADSVRQDATDVRAEGGPPHDTQVTTFDLRPAGECPDLDENGVLDCKETLVANGAFASDGAAWDSEWNMQHAFSAGDGYGNPASGSLEVVNASMRDAAGWTMGGARQCVPAKAGVVYDIAVQLYIAKGQGEGIAGISVAYFDRPNCAGDGIAAYTSPMPDKTDAWTSIAGTTTAPPQTQSLALRLVAMKPFRQPSLRVRFDNVLFKAR